MGGVIGYGKDGRPRRGRKVFLGLAGLAFVVAVLSGVDALTARVENGWICGICASTHRRTDWRLGFSTSDQVRLTKLDAWISTNRGGHQHDWYNVRGAGLSLINRRRGSEHGSAPPILDLTSAGLGQPFIDLFVATASDEELAAFIDTMISGSKTEQQAAVDAAGDQVLRAMSGRPTTRDTAPAAP